MDERHKLEWIQRNRPRSQHVQLAGALIGNAVAHLATADNGRATALAKAIEAHVDDTFRRHCRVVGMRGGALVINVDQAGLLYSMRQQWSQLLGRVFVARGGGGANVRVRFELGDAGARVGRGSATTRGSE